VTCLVKVLINQLFDVGATISFKRISILNALVTKHASSAVRRGVLPELHTSFESEGVDHVSTVPTVFSSK
jgi:hypothetical protein